jgi:hypothetical protein
VCEKAVRFYDHVQDRGGGERAHARHHGSGSVLACVGVFLRESADFGCRATRSDLPAHLALFSSTHLHALACDLFLLN